MKKSWGSRLEASGRQRQLEAWWLGTITVKHEFVHSRRRLGLDFILLPSCSRMMTC